MEWKSGIEKRNEKTEWKNGMAEGKKNEKLTIAKNLKEIGIKIEDIVKATNLTKEEIEKL